MVRNFTCFPLLIPFEVLNVSLSSLLFGKGLQQDLIKVCRAVTDVTGRVGSLVGTSSSSQRRASERSLVETRVEF